MSRKFFIIFLFSLVTASFFLGGCKGGNSSPARKPNVLFLMLDTLRADHLGIFGYERDTTPHLDAFARENLLYTQAVTAAPWTPPSVASMFTGHYPSVHGMMPPNGREKALKNVSRLPDSADTLAEILKRSGYRTGAISPNPWIKEEFGFNQGFDRFRFFNRANADVITREGIEMIEEYAKASEPWFVYLHYLDPHDPYDPPGEFKTMFSGPLTNPPFAYQENALKRIGLYDGEIRFMDRELGRLFDFLKKQGLYDDLKIIILGDHGEQFGERGNFGHGFHVHAEEVHVPLMVRSGDSPKKVDATVSTIDVFPTVLEFAGVNHADSGSAALSLVQFEKLEQRLGVLTEIARKYEERAFTSTNGEKIIITYEMGSAEGDGEPRKTGVNVFNTTQDPVERNPINDDALLRSLYEDYTSHRSRFGGSHREGDGSHTVTDETIEQLKSLGYLQ